MDIIKSIFSASMLVYVKSWADMLANVAPEERTATEFDWNILKIVIEFMAV